MDNYSNYHPDNVPEEEEASEIDPEIYLEDEIYENTNQQSVKEAPETSEASVHKIFTQKT